MLPVSQADWLSSVAVCVVVSLFVQVIVSPTLALMVVGSKAMFFMLAATAPADVATEHGAPPAAAVAPPPAAAVAAAPAGFVGVALPPLLHAARARTAIAPIVIEDSLCMRLLQVVGTERPGRVPLECTSGRPVWFSGGSDPAR